LLHVCNTFDPSQVLPSEVDTYHLTSDEFYQRQWYSKTDRYEVLILFWKPGQRTQIHDHGGETGFDVVYRGHLREERFQPGENGWLKAGADQVYEMHHKTFIEIDLVHRVSNPSDDLLVSFHVYVGPLDRE
jgi:predicted metal-dependent enzyme (double-stranded beta helix superfamily)